MGATRIEGRVDLSIVKSESITRNTMLAKFLSWIKYVEREGCGINRAVTDCKENEAPLPMIESKDGFVVVTIFPGQKFDRVMRGEFEDRVTTSAEVVKAVEKEQFSYISTRSSTLEKLDALRKYARRNARSAHRVLRQLSDVPPKVILSFLREEANWDGDDLTAYVSNWIYQGNTNAEILGLLLEFAATACDVRTLAYVYYTIRGNKLPIEKGDFFRACWRPAPSDLKVETAQISASHGRVRFVMGSNDPDAPANERPAHEVELSPYRIGLAPVTCKEYGAFTSKASNDLLPIVSVTWWEAWIFCEWLGGTLPTEAQWECACRAGTVTKWWTGDDERALLQAAWVDEAEDGEPYPVRQKTPNPWGLFDVHGNVSEWCFDRYAAYFEGMQIDSSGPKSGHTRVLRGGNVAAPPDRSRSASRDHGLPSSTSLVTGFRIAFNDACPLT
jgi:formylglycine-generating enzyme required for sulfatase activity